MPPMRWGRAEAERLANEIREGQTPPTQLYYFATAPIFRQKSRAYSPGLFEEFREFYVSGFHDLCQTLRELCSKRRPGDLSILNRGGRSAARYDGIRQGEGGRRDPVRRYEPIAAGYSSSVEAIAAHSFRSDGDCNSGPLDARAGGNASHCPGGSAGAFAAALIPR